MPLATEEQERSVAQVWVSLEQFNDMPIHVNTEPPHMPILG